jgi:DNA-binding CsgD family transcriptional regulator
MGERAAQFTKRQGEVAMLIAAGCSDEEMGRTLGISPRTARAHADVLRQKLGVPRRRMIPLAFHEVTGRDLFAALVGGGDGNGA